MKSDFAELENYLEELGAKRDIYEKNNNNMPVGLRESLWISDICGTDITLSLVLWGGEWEPAFYKRLSSNSFQKISKQKAFDELPSEVIGLLILNPFSF